MIFNNKFFYIYIFSIIICIILYFKIPFIRKNLVSFSKKGIRFILGTYIIICMIVLILLIMAMSIT